MLRDHITVSLKKQETLNSAERSAKYEVHCFKFCLRLSDDAHQFMVCENVEIHYNKQLTIDLTIIVLFFV